MARNRRNTIRISIAFLSAWSGFMLILYFLRGVTWFHLGDFRFRTAMAYHGILIPAWLMLALAYSRIIDHSRFIGNLLGTGAVSAGILTGIGSVLINNRGVSLGTGIQVTGMILAEITVLGIIIGSFWHHFKTPQNGIDTTAWWTVSIGLVGLSLATPLGHLAGAAKDLGEKLPILVRHAALLGLSPKAVVDGYVGSHSHQVLAAFLAAGFALPLIGRAPGKPSAVKLMEKIGLVVVAGATIAQLALYQYCAFSGWEPPDLFSNGPNGLPLDDFILIVLGLGMLLLLPSLLATGKEIISAEDHSRYTNRIVTLILLAYMISVVFLGLYIEFHEQYFGHGVGNAAGVPNDLAYIRAHLLFGFMVIPILMGTLLNGSLLTSRKQICFSTVFAIIVIIAGIAGTFLWTFFLNDTVIKITIFLTIVFLFVYSLQLIISTGYISHRKNILERE